MSHFKMPPWARAPAQPGGASLVVENDTDNAAAAAAPPTTIDVSRQPAYTLGRAEPALVDLPIHPPAGQTDSQLASLGVSRVHAAIVHHEDGRTYLIDLESRGGTTLDGARVEKNRPTRLRDGARLQFGSLGRTHVYRCSQPVSSGGRQQQQQQQQQPQMPATVRASHLLIKHAQSRRPSSFREPVVTRSPQEALEDIERLRAEILGRVSANGEALFDVFSELAERESHCSSAKRGGDLGAYGPGQMQRAFEDATYALRVGELSGPVHSDSGVHLILRTA
jgi:NIMA-interacting peptidyl-prolyl cis-trans isomerase 1